jgi:hypothetical protein
LKFKPVSNRREKNIQQVCRHSFCAQIYLILKFCVHKHSYISFIILTWLKRFNQDLNFSPCSLQSSSLQSSVLPLHKPGFPITFKYFPTSLLLGVGWWIEISMGIFNWIATVKDQLPSINGKSSLPTKFPCM